MLVIFNSSVCKLRYSAYHNVEYPGKASQYDNMWTSVSYWCTTSYSVFIHFQTGFQKLNNRSYEIFSWILSEVMKIDNFTLLCIWIRSFNKLLPGAIYYQCRRKNMLHTLLKKLWSMLHLSFFMQWWTKFLMATNATRIFLAITQYCENFFVNLLSVVWKNSGA